MEGVQRTQQQIGRIIQLNSTLFGLMVVRRIALRPVRHEN